MQCAKHNAFVFIRHHLYNSVQQRHSKRCLGGNDNSGGHGQTAQPLLHSLAKAFAVALREILDINMQLLVTHLIFF